MTPSQAPARRPLLVLLHGTRFSARFWSGYAEALDADVVAVDLPGHGTRAGQPWSTEAAMAVVDEAVATDPDAPLVLAGHSLGGFVAASWAQRHPDALAALVLIGAMGEPRRHPWLTRTYLGFARVVELLGGHRMAVVSNRVLRAMGVPPDEMPDASGYAVMTDAWREIVASASADQVAELTCPVWLVSGQLDQLGIDARHYAGVARDPRRVVVPRATHLLPMTHQRALIEVLAQACREASEPPRRTPRHPRRPA